MFHTVTLVQSSRSPSAVELEPTLLAVTHSTYQRAFERGEGPEPTPLSIGQIVAGKYRVERLLGAGGMGAVYAVRHEVTGKELALKCMNAEVAGSVRAVRRFVREARAAGRIHHPNVVDVYDIGQDGSLSFIIMEMLRGQVLSERLQQGALSPKEAVDIMVQLLRGVAAAHEKGVVHRDLKPENIFLCEEIGRDGRETLVPKILDFGIAKILCLRDDASLLTQSGAFLGTPAYISPEQAEGAEVDARTDLYSCGVILYRMLTGELPHRAETLNQFLRKLTQEDPAPPDLRAAHLGSELSRVVIRALAREPSARYPDAESFARALSTHGDGVRFSGPPPSSPQTLLRGPVIALMIVGAACLAALTTWLVLRLHRPVAVAPAELAPSASAAVQGGRAR